MELRTLRYFLVVAREQNITKAAELLYITQPTLSRQLMALEEELGVSLFIRSNRKMELSEAGQILKRRAEEIIQLTDLAQKEVGTSAHPIAGEISIGCGITQATETMGKFISSFQKKYPGVVFHIQNGNSEGIMEKIDKGLLDVGIVLDPDRIDHYDFIRLKEKEKWGLLMHKDDPLACKQYIKAEDLRASTLIGTPRLDMQNHFRQWLGTDEIDFHLAATSELSSTAATLVKNHVGRALIIEGAAADLRSDLFCFRLLAPELNSNSYVIWKKYLAKNDVMTAFLLFLNDYLGKSEVDK